jgi:tetrahydromethanopterin S-methyltransferase subunit G
VGMRRKKTMKNELKKINDRLEAIEENTQSEFDFTLGQYVLSLGVILVGFIIALIFIIK